jgi:hypothetical protein
MTLLPRPSIASCKEKREMLLPKVDKLYSFNGQGTTKEYWSLRAYYIATFDASSNIVHPWKSYLNKKDVSHVWKA